MTLQVQNLHLAFQLIREGTLLRPKRVPRNAVNKLDAANELPNNVVFDLLRNRQDLSSDLHPSSVIQLVRYPRKLMSDLFPKHFVHHSFASQKDVPVLEARTNVTDDFIPQSEMIHEFGPQINLYQALIKTLFGPLCLVAARNNLDQLAFRDLASYNIFLVWRINPFRMIGSHILRHSRQSELQSLT